jgi:hypothetical protein
MDHIRHSQISLDVVACQRIEGDEMKNLVAVLLCIAIPIMAFAGDNSYKVTYDGGSLPDIPVWNRSETIHRVQSSSSRERQNGHNDDSGVIHNRN